MMPWTKLAILWNAYEAERRNRPLRDVQVRLNLLQSDTAAKLKSLETQVRQLSESNQRLRQELRSKTTLQPHALKENG